MPDHKSGATKKGLSPKDNESHCKKLAEKWLKDHGISADSAKTRLTATEAKLLLGWTEVADSAACHFTDEDGKSIVCFNNQSNRLLPKSVIRTMALDILNRNWAYNGESIIISREGNVLSAQRRLLGLVLAEQLRLRYKHWEAYWSEPCFIEAVVIYDVNDSPKTMRTVDNTRPRTVFDVFFTNPALAKIKSNNRKLTVKERTKLAKIMNTAVRVVWRRSGMEENMFHSRYSNSELISFYERHPRLLQAALHVFEEDADDEGEKAKQGGKYGLKISRPGRWLNAGTAAALLYLMGTSTSDKEAYHNPKANKDGIRERSEKSLDFANWEKACNFWTMLAGEDESGDYIRAAGSVRRPCDDPNDKISGRIFSEGTTVERVCVLVKAWECYLRGDKPTVAKLKLRYDKNKDAEGNPLPNPVTGLYDASCLNDDPTCGGIDCGWNPNEEESGAPKVEETADPWVEAGEMPEDFEPAAMTANDPKPDDIAKERDAIRAENCREAGLIDTGNLD